jgi:hypothetical protein
MLPGIHAADEGQGEEDEAGSALRGGNALREGRLGGFG